MGYPIQLGGGWSKLAEEVDEELCKARKKFPSSDLAVTALSEECGEAIKAILNHYHLRKRRGQGDASQLMDIRKELVQTMAMCIRVALEGDAVHMLEGLGE